MLIRDPVDRLVSHINDNRRRGSKHQRKHTVEELVQNLMKHPARGKMSGFEGALSYQGENLANLLSVFPDPSDVLIIPMESMSTPPKQCRASPMPSRTTWERSDGRCLIITTIRIRTTTIAAAAAATMFFT